MLCTSTQITSALGARAVLCVAKHQMLGLLAITRCFGTCVHCVYYRGAWPEVAVERMVAEGPRYAHRLSH